MLLLLALATSLAANLPNQSQAPAESTRNSGRQAPQPPNAGSGTRKIPCRTPENASLCYWTHGRLSAYEGDPTYRIWKIRTRRILGVFNGPSHFPPSIASFDDDVFNPEFPANLEQAYLTDRRRWQKEGNTDHEPPDIFADFEVCPLEAEKKGEMQAVCIESAKNVYVEKRWR